MWFAFILWTTDIYNNKKLMISKLKLVVICFHSLNYWYLQQLDDLRAEMLVSCDLLSFFELLIFTTTNGVIKYAKSMLWFAFILWTTDIYNNSEQASSCYYFVVICFHSLNYWYLQQQVVLKRLAGHGCDLLSFFELLIFTTTMKRWFPLII